MADRSAFHQSSRADLTSDLSSRWYSAGNAIIATGGTMVLQPSQLYGVPYLSGDGGRATEIGINVTGAGQSGMKAQVGIYAVECLTSPVPHGIVLSGSALAIDATGVKFKTIVFSFRPDTMYWFAVCAQGSATVRAITSPWPVLGHNPSSVGLAYLSLVVSQGYGLLPTYFPATSATATHSVPPAIGVRYAETLSVT